MDGRWAGSVDPRKGTMFAMTHETTAERLAEANNVLQVADQAAKTALMALDDEGTDALTTSARGALASFQDRLAQYRRRWHR